MCLRGVCLEIGFFFISGAPLKNSLEIFSCLSLENIISFGTDSRGLYNWEQQHLPQAQPHTALPVWVFQSFQDRLMVLLNFLPLKQQGPNCALPSSGTAFPGNVSESPRLSHLKRCKRPGLGKVVPENLFQQQRRRAAIWGPSMTHELQTHLQRLLVKSN